MPGATPNRGYPYPLQTDSTNVPGDIQALAEAWDADLTTVSNSIVTRPTFRVSSTTALTIPLVFVSSTTLPFESIDLNESGAFTPTPSGSQTSIRPIVGFWYLTATCVYPRTAFGTPPNLDEMGISIRSGATILTMRNTHGEPVAGENRSLSCGTAVFLDGNTDIQAVFSANRTTAIPTYTVFNRSFTGFRMTES